LTYRVLYREWRPQDFKNLVGQEHISITLQNAINKKRIAHAYIFTGPRGTGKTSTAKILAKAVNCESPIEGEPCNNCNNCKSINEGRSLDIIEIDAASNRGIDEIRDLRERVSYVPTQGKYKVYIIDEVHMLTTEAFNALLKTLEEPPGHILFILATTEPYRIPSTIMSRCQRFDFRKIAPIEMEGRLQEILIHSNLTAEEGVLTLVVRKADGALRDAISILDQCISFSNGQITLKTAYEVLGLVKNDALVSLTKSYIEKDAPSILVQVNNMLKGGLEPGQIIKDFLEHLRSMIILMVCGLDTSLVLGNSEEKLILMQQAKDLGIDWLSDTVARLAKIDNESRWRQNMRIVLETTLLGLLWQTETKTISTYQTKIKPEIKPEIKPITKNVIQQKDASITLERITESWNHIMEAIKIRKKSVHAFLTVSEPKEIREGVLILAFKEGYTFHKEKIEEQDNRELIEEELDKCLGVRLKVVCNIEGDTKKTDDPVQKALDLFGPEVVTIKD
jgi:DNA polymerase-3 subunit gamma/tau